MRISLLYSVLLAGLATIGWHSPALLASTKHNSAHTLLVGYRSWVVIDYQPPWAFQTSVRSLAGYRPKAC